MGIEHLPKLGRRRIHSTGLPLEFEFLERGCIAFVPSLAEIVSETPSAPGPSRDQEVDLARLPPRVFYGIGMMCDDR
jgi:hypothetical protein